MISFPEFRRRWWGFHWAVALFAPLATLAQTPASPTVSIVKTSTFRQAPANTLEDAGSQLRIQVAFPLSSAPNEYEVELRRGSTVVRIPRVSAAGYEYLRSFGTQAEMEAVLPDGTYSLVAANGSTTVEVSSEPDLLNARVVNLDALQRWNGRDAINVTVSPVPVGGPTSMWASLAIRQGGSQVLSASAQLTSSPFTFTAWIPSLSAPVTEPGEALQAELTLPVARRLSAHLIYRTVILQFPVARAHLPPQISEQPVARTVAAGEPAVLSVRASGGGLSYVWQKDGLPLPGATQATLSIAAAAPKDAGSYAVLVSNTGGTILSAAVRLTVNPMLLPPRVIAAPASVTATAGEALTLTVRAEGTAPLSYQWFHDGRTVPGATGDSLAVPVLRVGDAGSYTVAIANPAGTVTSAPAVVAVRPVTRLANLSIRTRAGGSHGTLVVGVSISGGAPGATKPLLFRAVGPTLALFGIGDALSDPQLALHAGTRVFATNDDWGGARALEEAAGRVGAFALASASSKDAAVVAAPEAGGYAVQVSGKAEEGGTVLAEVYDATLDGDFLTSTPRLTNLSALARTTGGDDPVISGFAITGGAPILVLVRGVGPALRVFGVAGVLADPRLGVFAAGSAAPLATNDNWSESSQAAEIARVAAQVGAFALADGAADAALLVSLAPGTYTVQVSGPGGAAGLALIEIYEVR
jgi:hypothetical protein